MNRTNDRHQMATARYAVFFADISGYTALLDSSRRAIQHIVDFKEFACLELAAHGGNVIDRIGDHIIALFDSKESCVNAAVAVQQLLHVENQSFPPKLRLHFRVALHYGHVSLYQAEHHGPALNIASRMQEVAPPGGILFSDDFMDCVRTLNFAYRETGDYQFKNLTSPLKTLR